MVGDLTSAIDSETWLLSARAMLELVAKDIGLKVYAFILQPVEELDTSKTLKALDCLVTVEIRNWIKRIFAEWEFLVYGASTGV